MTFTYDKFCVQAVPVWVCFGFYQKLDLVQKAAIDKAITCSSLKSLGLMFGQSSWFEIVPKINCTYMYDHTMYVSLLCTVNSA